MSFEYSVGYITGWVATIVVIFVLPLLVVGLVILRWVYKELADIRDILSPTLSSEKEESDKQHGWYSYLKKLSPWGVDDYRHKHLNDNKHDKTSNNTTAFSSHKS